MFIVVDFKKFLITFVAFIKYTLVVDSHFGSKTAAIKHLQTWG